MAPPAVAGSPATCRSCTASPASVGLTSSSSIGSPATRVEAGADRQRGLDAVPARRLRRGVGRVLPGQKRRPARLDDALGPASAFWITWKRYGTSPTKGSGRSAAPGGISRTPRSWPGSPSTGPSIVEAVRHRRTAWTAGGRPRRDPRRGLPGGFDKDLNSFVQSYGSALDASLLMIPPVGFLPADDPRMRDRRGDRGAADRDGFVRRYDSGVRGRRPATGRGAFLPCTFWLADNLAARPVASTRPERSSTVCWGPQRCRPALRGIRPRTPASSATSRRPSPTWR